MSKDVAEEWLDNEDVVTRSGRLARLRWLESVTPDGEGTYMIGGAMAGYLFEEARYCFAYGQFLSTVVLGMSFIERSFAARFYMEGRNDIERANISTLLSEALAYGWIDKVEFEELDEIRQSRNPITHFRKYAHEDSIEYRSVLTDSLPYEIFEKDAYTVMKVVIRMASSTFSFGGQSS
jgi:hypothetical protein